MLMIAVAIVAAELAAFILIADMIPQRHGSHRYLFAAGFLAFEHVVLFGTRYLDRWRAQRYRRIRRRPFRDTRRG